MSFVHFLNYLSIIIIGAFCAYLVHFVAGSKYSLAKAFIRGLFFGDFWYFQWFYRNSIYIWTNILILLLICTNLTLITQFSANNIFQKPLFVFMVSPMLWTAIFVVFFIALSKYKKS